MKRQIMDNKFQEGSIRSLISFLEKLEENVQKGEENPLKYTQEIPTGSKAYAILVELDAYELRLNSLINDLDVLHGLYLRRTEDLKKALKLPLDEDIMYGKDDLGTYHILGAKK